jgi:hypothetical protein
MATVDGTRNSLNRNSGKPSEWTILGTGLVKNTTLVTVRYPHTATNDASSTHIWDGRPHHVTPDGMVAVVNLKCRKCPQPVKDDLDTTDIVSLIVDATAANIGDVTMYTE